MGNDRETTKGAGCFGCSSENPRGLALVFRRIGESVEAETTLGDTFAGYDGLVHGGIVTTLLDEAMGWAILELAGRFAVTRNLRVDFRRPVFVDRPLRIEARLDGEEPDGAVRVLSSVYDLRGRLLASAVGVWVLVRQTRVKAAKGARP